MTMLHEHTFDFRFESRETSPIKIPTLLFKIDRRNQAELYERLERITTHDSEQAEEYFGSYEPFEMLASDIAGTPLFGYGRCGVAQNTGTESILRIGLLPDLLPYAARTVYVLTEALRVPLTHSCGGFQQLIVDTVCTNSVAGYGHGVSGYLFDNVVHWLVQYPSSFNENRARYPLPAIILDAMRDTQKELTRKFKVPPESDSCNGWITEAGEFVLTCIGDACDLATSDEPLVGKESFVEFSCHNLDTALQQMVLLAGLGALCDTATSEQA